MQFDQVTVIGGGLAGSECAIQLADRGFAVKLCEMRPQVSSPAHHTDHLAELVCSNSFKSTRPDSAAGLLKAELERMGSVLLDCAHRAAVPAGGALAVDRVKFSELVEAEVAARPNIEVVHGEVTQIPEGHVVIAAGPLCSPALSEEVMKLVGGDAWHSSMPRRRSSMPPRSIWTCCSRSRATRSRGAATISTLRSTRRSTRPLSRRLPRPTAWCSKTLRAAICSRPASLPRKLRAPARTTIRFGAMKPVGLTDPRTGRRPWAAIQLRAENKEKTAYNLVGFQTNLTFGEQKRVFHMVPGLENAEFFRYGVMHRNTFVDAPHVLDGTFAVPGTGVRLAGQITGTEGYMEAVATGLLAALNTYAEAIGAAGVELPRVGALGALVGYATDPATVGYQPMHVNFGLVPPLEDGKRRSKRDRYQAYADRALEALDAYLATRPDLFGGDRS